MINKCMDNRYDFEFSVTSFCQAKCRSCSRFDDDGELIKGLVPAHVPIERFKQSVNNLEGVHVGQIILCGEHGDPMMHPKIGEIIEYASKNHIVNIMTNGGLRNPAFYEKLAKNKRVAISWGIDGLDHDTNWKYREGVDFNRAWDNMTTWFKHTTMGRWEFLIFEWNYHQIQDVYNTAKKLGIQIEFKLNTRQWGYLQSPKREEVIEQLKHLHKG